MKEVDFQRKLIDLIKGAGGHAFKLSNRFQAGVPDLCVTMPAIPPAEHALPTRLIEIKVISPNGNLGLTPLQRAFMRAHQKGGGAAMWLGFRKALDGAYFIWVGWDPETEAVYGAPDFKISRGQAWPIRDIIRG